MKYNIHYLYIIMTDRDVFLCDNTNMTGGKLISEGGYGCLYYPEINCRGKQTN